MYSGTDRTSKDIKDKDRKKRYQWNPALLKLLQKLRLSVVSKEAEGDAVNIRRPWSIIEVRVRVRV